ncbi:MULTISPECIES: hypothetical protein [unclassified Rhodococcus (in: high G+C Gram-positive bacteria)]|uniref:hypothetical protein n=1 Tax=unclassified Rhodococcus (in: high G+C Gram-positive bacteria) TaxID=192944 RepID=UPI00163A3748|nr:MULTISPECIES: hypothetical protein [unclassified Rhodococcus (in: high G+C Gram-positive bacteria)]MBC2644581.1 hypothetical protein [Rhodococcus sp. 3A]MBC2897730.1 hypothetical protein [Rhodococcus sp. 4CII]
MQDPLVTSPAAPAPARRCRAEGIFHAVELVVDRLTWSLAGVSGKGSGPGEGAGPLAFCVAAAAGRVLTKPNQPRGGGNRGPGVVQ